MLWDDYWYDLTFDYTKYNPIDKTNTVCSHQVHVCLSILCLKELFNV